MKTRIISGLIMAPLLFVLYLGGVWLWIAALAIALIGVYEFCKGWENIDVHPSRRLCWIMTFILFIPRGYIITKQAQGSLGIPDYYAYMADVCVWLFAAVMLSLVYGWKVNERGPHDVTATITAMVYIPFFIFHMVLIDMTEYRLFVWIVVIAAFGSDIFAYFTGYFLGRHKMAPTLSPKKTIEGAIGGLIGSSVLSWMFAYVFMRDMASICLVLGLVGGAAGMAGDLTASAFKRQMGIKDYGSLIPGHGGIMDRFDSVLFVAPVIYYAICVINGLISNI